MIFQLIIEGRGRDRRIQENQVEIIFQKLFKGFMWLENKGE